jgi:hypothetical protein
MQHITLKIRSIILAVLVILSSLGFSQDKPNYLGQDLNTITTAVPFLMIAPDARSGAMGDGGVTSTPDAASMHWNPAKYAFVEKDMGFSVSYSPWLRALVSDINLAYLAGYKRIDDKQTIGGSLLYFSLGDITFTDIQGEVIGNYKPNEFSVDLTYARKLGPVWSGAVSARYIYSNLTQGQYVAGAATHAGMSVATDVAFYYTKELSMKNMDAAWLNLGFNISNIGAKISYSDDNTQKDFIPTNLRFGPSLTIDFNEYNRFSFMIDANKLLVPTPPRYDTVDGETVIVAGMDPEVGVVKGMYQSFYDAPDGFSEEMREFSFAIGTEYWYDKQFAVRGGFFWEDKTKGNRKFFTLGAGLRYNVFGLDFSYLIPTDQKNPLENTLRFTLTFDFEAVSRKPQEEFTQ